MNKLLITLITFLFLCRCSASGKYEDLQNSLAEFVSDKDASIGIAVIVDSKDTLSVNGDKSFPMLSTYKFPIALTCGDFYRRNNLSPDLKIAVLPEYLHIDTYSPMTEKLLASSRISTDTLMLRTDTLLAYMLQQSDNNASDILLRTVNGPVSVDEYMNRLGINDINIKNSEYDMHINNSLCYENSSTPLSMACLLDKFDNEFNDPFSILIKRLMETCETGNNRLAKPFAQSNVVIGHKTGTGFMLSNGRMMAVNDVGYVHLANGHHYTIAVFIENSGYDLERNEEIIAEISQIVFSQLHLELL